MKHKNKAFPSRKQWETRLSLENLESRQMLSVSPYGVDVDTVESVVSHSITSNDLYADLTIASTENSRISLQADDLQNDEVEEIASLNATATGNKLNIQFPADANENYTVVVVGTDNSGTGKDVIAFKSVKAAKNKIQDGMFTYAYTGKDNYSYDVYVVNGKYTAKEYQAAEGEIPEDFLVGTDFVSTLSPLTLSAAAGTATSTSITFQQSSDVSIDSLDNLVFLAKFDGDRVASTYTVEGNSLICGERSYDITLNENGSITIDGLKLNTKHSFQVAQTSENAISAYSKSLTIATTKEQVAAPEMVEAHLIYNEDDPCLYGSLTSNVLVEWQGEVGQTYTITYSYTDSKGKLVTKTATKNATVDEDGYGEFVATKLPARSILNFSVSANKTKDYDASAFVSANGIYDQVIVPDVIPAPTLKKTAATDTSVSFQITNWSKMESSLMAINPDASIEYGEGDAGEIVVDIGDKLKVIFHCHWSPDSDLNEQDPEWCPNSYSFSTREGEWDSDKREISWGNEVYCYWYVGGVYSLDEDGEWMWVDSSDINGAIEIVQNKNNRIATITIDGLDANTNYNFQVTALNTHAGYHGNPTVLYDYYVNNLGVYETHVDEDGQEEFVGYNFGVAPTASKVLKVKTDIAAYEPATELVASEVTSRGMNLSWTPSEAGSYIVTLTPENGGKTVTKTVKGSSVTVTGLTPNTNYSVSVVAKADKNGSQSVPTTITALTAGEFSLQKITQVKSNSYALDFGIDMTQYSGYLDFTVSGTGKVAYVNNGRTINVSDSIPKTNCTLFFGQNAQSLVQAYLDENPNANILVVTDDATYYNLNVTTSRYDVDLDFGFRFAASNDISTLEFGFPQGYSYSVNGTVQLNNGVITNNETGETLSAKLGSKLTVKYSG